MKQVTRLSTILAIALLAFVVGCTGAKTTGSDKAGMIMKKVEASGFEVVEFDYVKPKSGMRMFKEVVLVDTRPGRKYDGGTIPGSINIHDVQFAEHYSELAALNLPKTTEVITFCGGFECAKSLNVANSLKKEGWTNVKIYHAGFPDWKKHKVHIEIGSSTAKKMWDKAEAVFVDARPGRVFKKDTIPGSVNVHDKEYEKMKGNLPADKDATFVVYCGGFACEKSHNVASDMMKDGYTKNVYIYAAGFPEWKKAGYPTAAKGGKAPKAPSAATGGGAIIPGADEGTVNIEFMKTLIGATPGNVTIVDVRSADEYNAGHAPDAVNIPINDIYQDNGCDTITKALPKEGYVIFMCASGGRAGEMWWGLKEDCNYPAMDRLYFLDATVSYAGGSCTIN